MKNHNTLKKSDVIAFFDRLAPAWDTAPRDEDGKKLQEIFRQIDVKKDMRVLDIACGTGILTELYLSRGACQVTGVDISPKMIDRARTLHTDPRAEFLCADASCHNFAAEFDRCVIYNALPHFPDPQALCRHLHKFLAKEGRLIIAHSAGRQKVNSRHHREAGAVSLPLPDADQLAAALSSHYRIDAIRSDGEIYYVSATRKELSNSMDHRDVLLQQIAAHENFQMRDAVKLSFQASFGAEHLLSDVSAAKRYLHEEFESTPPRDEPLYEQIAEDVCRINIGAWKALHLPEEWLLALFVQSAQDHAAKIDRAQGEAAFAARLDAVSDLAKEKKLPDCFAQWEDFKADYLAGGIRAVHHSDIYRQSSRPAYRVVSGRMCRMLPVFEKLAERTDGAPFVIAIDGRAASGKSTMAEQLCRVLDVDAVHMDDFFLPPELRTEDRLAEAGGNIHYERFRSEVLPRLKQSEGFAYQRFDCSQMALGQMQHIRPGSIRVVEGSYSHHGIFGDYADLRVVCDVEPQEQMRRILLRNGERMAEMFRTRWIPMEERYFAAMDIRNQADLIL